MNTLTILAMGLMPLLAPTPRSTGIHPDLFHFELEKSAPAAQASVAPPAEIRLWFTQVPQENTTSIHLLDAAGEPVQTGEVVQDPEDGMVFSVKVSRELAPATYTVAWRALGDDGHVVRGEFEFTVTPA